MASIKIRPLHIGKITRQKMAFCYWLDPGEIADIPLISYYIEGADKNILVDTGGGDPNEANPHWLPYERKEDQTIQNALRKIGVSCDEIDIVINTHLHWDHCGGNALFPKATIFVQQAELESAHAPLPLMAHGYNKRMVEDIEYTVISGDQKIVDGVQVILTPGHTYGMQGVLVEGEKNRYFIASDTFGFFKNLEINPPTPSGIYVDLKKYYQSIQRIGELKAFILPGHDFKVFDSEIYL